MRRRTLLIGTGAVAANSVLAGRAEMAHAQIAMPAQATEDYHAARAEVLAGRPIEVGRVKLAVPRIAESGNSVPLAVRVDSPMTAADHVRTIHILAEKNPYALIARVHLGPRAGVADVATHVRLATTQTLHAIAEMSDGSLFEGTAESVVALAACLDGS